MNGHVSGIKPSTKQLFGIVFPQRVQLILLTVSSIRALAQAAVFLFL